VHNDRQALPAGGEVGRPGHVAAEAHHDLGPHMVEHRPGRQRRVAQPARRLQQGPVQLARQRRRRYELERVAAGRDDERGVQAADGAQRGDLGRGLQPAQRVGEVDRGLDVPGRMAAGDNDARCCHACPVKVVSAVVAAASSRS
jgi:hypothetical protein